MVSLKFLIVSLSLLITLNTANHESTDTDEDVAITAEDELTEGNKEAAHETAEEDNSKYRVDSNLDGLVLLACIVGLVLFIIVFRYVCCAVDQCEEQANGSLSSRDKQRSRVVQTEKEIILQGMKYKALV